MSLICIKSVYKIGSVLFSRRNEHLLCRVCLGARLAFQVLIVSVHRTVYLSRQSTATSTTAQGQHLRLPKLSKNVKEMQKHHGKICKTLGIICSLNIRAPVSTHDISLAIISPNSTI